MQGVCNRKPYSSKVLSMLLSSGSKQTLVACQVPVLY